MGTIDNLIIKAKDLASAAGSKAQEVAEQTKVRVQAAQLKNDIDANYLKLGEIIYELRKSGAENEELINMCIEEISSQLEELDELNSKLDEMKRVLRCPECMKENPLDALYCQRCGASLKEQSPIQPDAGEAPEAAEAAAEEAPAE